MVKVSPSAITALASCERQFAFKYWGAPKQPPGKGAAFGTECHEQLEAYLAGKPLDFQNHKRAAETLAAGLHLLPKPLTAFSEGEFDFVYGGVPFNGRIDWYWFDPNTKLVQVGDLKTTKSISKYAKTPEDLEDDPQAIIYARSGLERFPEAIGVQLRWVYLQTEGAKKTLPTETYFDPQNVKDKLDDLLTVSKEVVRLRTVKPDPNDLEPNPSACESFGGCPYKDRCKLTFAERIKSMSGNVADQLAALKARMQAKTQSAETKPADPINPPEAAGQVAPASPPPKEPEAASAKPRGRPKKQVTDANETQAAADVKESVTKSDPPPSEHLIETLYVDCAPVNKGTRSIADVHAAAMALVSEGAGAPVDDWRFIDYKGGGMFAVAVVEVLRRTGGALGFVVDSQSPEGRACLEILKANAGTIVKGV